MKGHSRGNESLIKRVLCYVLTAAMIITAMFTGITPKAAVALATAADPVVIVLDPGHDYSHGGAYSKSTGGDETYANYAIAKACYDELNTYQNVKVYYTTQGECLCPGNSDQCLIQRTTYGHEVGCDLFVSLHCNSSEGLISDASAGSEVYISLTTPYNANQKQLATDILDGLSAIGFRNKGIKTRESSTAGNDYLSINRRSVNWGYSGILIEHGFVNNYKDAAKLKDATTLTQIGQSDATAIAKYFKLVKKNQKATEPTIEVTGCMNGFGWTGTVPGGLYVGTKSYGSTLGALKIGVNNNDFSGDISYEVYQRDLGWSGAKNGLAAGEETGLTEAIKISLSGVLEKNYDIYYRVYTANSGWLGWTLNGKEAGHINMSDTVRGLQVILQRKGLSAPGSLSNSFEMKDFVEKDSLISYNTYSEKNGWGYDVADGLTSGAAGSGKRIESLKVKNLTGVAGNIEYQVYSQTYGWLSWVKNGTNAGTENSGKRLEAFRIKLSGTLETKYDIYYRVYVQDKGWLDWAANGQIAGITGKALRIEGVQIKMVTKGGKAPGETLNAGDSLIGYSSYVEGFGWQYYTNDGLLSGTSGLGKRLESFKIVNKTGIDGNIEYQVHSQTYGWFDWTSNGKEAGVAGSGKRLEALRIRLTGDLAKKYDVYYRVHMQTYGWLDWAANGSAAGITGVAKRIEAIQVVLVQKGGAAPGNTWASGDAKIAYRSYVGNNGWQYYATDGVTSGIENGGKNISSLAIYNKTGVSGKIEYQVYSQTYGWLDWVSNGANAAKESEGKRLEAMRVRLTGDMANKYDVYYRAYVQGIGWLDWTANGNVAGILGKSLRMEAFEVQLVTKGEKAPGDTLDAGTSRISYSSYIEGKGWQYYSSDAITSGTTGLGKRIESFKIINKTGCGGNIEYQAYVQSYGWLDWVKDGEEAGMPDSGKRIEAVRIRLTGEIGEKYSVYYRTHIQCKGWTSWTKNGLVSGTLNMALRMEAIEVMLLPINDPFDYGSTPASNTDSIYYHGYVDGTGWQYYVSDGEISGTVGKAKQLDGIRVFNNTGIAGDVEYCAYSQTYGWLDWVKNGQTAGKTDERRRVEAVRIKLTGELAEKYDVYYRAHMQTVGWLGWAKNGEPAGFTGSSLRMEAIQIVLVKKGADGPTPYGNAYFGIKVEDKVEEEVKEEEKEETEESSEGQLQETDETSEETIIEMIDVTGEATIEATTTEADTTEAATNEAATTEEITTEVVESEEVSAE